MEKLYFSVTINAPKQKVWETMLNDETYRQWTEVFNPTGSYYEGEWKTGSTMRFLGPDEKGVSGGMLSQIKEVRPYDYVSIKHIGEIKDGKEVLWTGELEGVAIFENYTFTEKDGVTEVAVDLDTNDAYKEMFQDMWPKALGKLKSLAEN